MEDNKSGFYNIVFILLLMVIAGANVVTAANRGSANITVVGQGKVSAKPEEVTLIVTRATMGDSADEAITQGDLAMSKLIDVVKRIAGNTTEIKKSFYQVTPQTGGKYVMANAISVKSNNVAAANNLVKYLYANGATTVSNVSFNPKDDGKSEAEARDEAIKDARKKADDMAKTMGKKIGRIVSVADDNTSLSSSIGEGVYTGSDIGSISMEKKVSVVYEIK